MSNSQGRNLGRSVIAARTSGLSIIQGDLGESGKGILQPVLLCKIEYSQTPPTQNIIQSLCFNVAMCHNQQTYKPFTLVGPTVTRPVQDPLAVTRLENQLALWWGGVEGPFHVR